MAAFLEWNMEVLRAIAALRSGALDAFNALITHLGEETLFMVVLMFVFWCVDKRRGYYLMMVGFAGTVLNQMLKIMACIPRPWILDPDFPIVESARAQATGYSFPSGHAQNAVGTFGGLAATEKRKAVKIACMAPAVLVPFSRLYLGVHTPFDVVTASLCALALLFALLPVYRAMERKPGMFVIVWCVMILFTFVLMDYAETRLMLAESQGMTEADLTNFAHAVKNANCMLGASLGGLAVYVLDEKFTRFDTGAVWWAQGIKLALGLALVVAVKAALKAPLYAWLGAAGDIVRYGMMILTAGALWPLSFRFFARLGGKGAKEAG